MTEQTYASHFQTDKFSWKRCHGLVFPARSHDACRKIYMKHKNTRSFHAGSTTAGVWRHGLRLGHGCNQDGVALFAPEIWRPGKQHRGSLCFNLHGKPRWALHLDLKQQNGSGLRRPGLHGLPCAVLGAKIKVENTSSLLQASARSFSHRRPGPGSSSLPQKYGSHLQIKTAISNYYYVAWRTEGEGVTCRQGRGHKRSRCMWRPEKKNLSPSFNLKTDVPQARKPTSIAHLLQEEEDATPWVISRGRAST